MLTRSAVSRSRNDTSPNVSCLNVEDVVNVTDADANTEILNIISEFNMSKEAHLNVRELDGSIEYGEWKFRLFSILKARRVLG